MSLMIFCLFAHVYTPPLGSRISELSPLILVSGYEFVEFNGKRENACVEKVGKGKRIGGVPKFPGFNVSYSGSWFRYSNTLWA
ncbi:hypothetical protein DFH06DRAFT_1243129 [Mycena polygramma]|nr:hypothetical protein DFH06DRAFT_1243129 [Mycena polygramma]